MYLSRFNGVIFFALFYQHNVVMSIKANVGGRKHSIVRGEGSNYVTFNDHHSFEFRVQTRNSELDSSRSASSAGNPLSCTSYMDLDSE